ncbi:MAG: hypothetical protein ACPGRD_02285 [Planktomarina sp.]
MRALVLLVGFAISITGPANALSCVRPDAAALYIWAQESEDVYQPVLAQIDSPRQKPVETGAPPDYRATVVGHSLTQDGFTKPISTTITVRSGCAGPWCGAALDSGKTYLAVLRVAENDLILDIGPCPFTAIAEPATAQIQTFVNCAQGKTCRPMR